MFCADQGELSELRRLNREKSRSRQGAFLSRSSFIEYVRYGHHIQQRVYQRDIKLSILLVVNIKYKIYFPCPHSRL